MLPRHRERLAVWGLMREAVYDVFKKIYQVDDSKEVYFVIEAGDRVIASGYIRNKQEVGMSEEGLVDIARVHRIWGNKP